jgi:hypothetical protein
MFKFLQVFDFWENVKFGIYGIIDIRILKYKQYIVLIVFNNFLKKEIDHVNFKCNK